MKFSILSFPSPPFFGGVGVGDWPNCMQDFCALVYLLTCPLCAVRLVIWFSDREKYQLIVRLLNLKSASMAVS